MEESNIVEVDVTGWGHDQIYRYLDRTLDGFTVEQVGHMAWYLGIKHEQMLREREATMHQNDNEEDSNGDDKDYPAEQ